MVSFYTIVLIKNESSYYLLELVRFEKSTFKYKNLVLFLQQLRGFDLYIQ